MQHRRRRRGQRGAANAQQTAIMGGQIRALQAVRAGTIGSPAGVPTLVQAGLDPHADIKRTALTRKRVKMNEEKAKLEQLLLFLHCTERATGDVVDRARNTHAKLGRDLVSLEEEEAQLVRDRSRSTQPASRPAGAIAAA